MIHMCSNVTLPSRHPSVVLPFCHIPFFHITILSCHSVLAFAHITVLLLSILLSCHLLSCHPYHAILLLCHTCHAILLLCHTCHVILLPLSLKCTGVPRGTDRLSLTPVCPADCLWNELPRQQGLCSQRPSSKEHSPRW